MAQFDKKIVVRLRRVLYGGVNVGNDWTIRAEFHAVDGFTPLPTVPAVQQAELALAFGDDTQVPPSALVWERNVNRNATFVAFKVDLTAIETDPDEHDEGEGSEAVHVPIAVSGEAEASAVFFVAVRVNDERLTGSWYPQGFPLVGRLVFEFEAKYREPILPPDPHR